MLELTDVRLRCSTDASPVAAALDFSQQFVAGEITVVLGANQSGKTNLCRLIAGLPADASGHVSLDGVPLPPLGSRQRPVSLVYQAFVNYPNLTVAQNIASPMQAAHVAVADRRAQVQDLAQRVGLSDLLQRYPHELSGGQQQRLAIARALAKRARVLVLDEPLVNLDFKLREALEAELRDLLRASGMIVVYTSSDPRDAFNLGDRLLLLDRGGKLQAGTPMQVYNTPTSFRAMELLAEPAVNYFRRSDILCALRPEHVSVAPLQDRGSSLQFSMQLAACETNGDETFLRGQVDDREWVVRHAGMLNVTPGGTLSLYAASDDVVHF